MNEIPILRPMCLLCKVGKASLADDKKVGHYLHCFRPDLCHFYCHPRASLLESVFRAAALSGCKTSGIPGTLAQPNVLPRASLCAPPNLYGSLYIQRKRLLAACHCFRLTSDGCKLTYMTAV